MLHLQKSSLDGFLRPQGLGRQIAPMEGKAVDRETEEKMAG